MSIETEAELAKLRAAGRVVAESIRAMRAQVRPGVTTGELDLVAARVFARAGARSGPQLDYGFPGVTCISVNDEAVHGVPGPRKLRDGDLVKLDVTAELDGFYADACLTVPVGRPRPALLAMIAAGRVALERAMATARHGVPVNEVGRVVEEVVTSRGYAVCRELTGHGIGRRIHEWPLVPNYFDPESQDVLSAGLVLTIEPIISSGDGEVHETGDGWTIATDDGAPSAHIEHTMVITDGAPLVLTA